MSPAVRRPAQSVGKTRLLAIGAALAAIAALPGCTFTLAGQPVTVTAADVKAAVAASCSLVPTAQQITQAVDAANKTAATAEATAQILCAGAQPFIAPTPATPAQPATPPATGG